MFSERMSDIPKIFQFLPVKMNYSYTIKWVISIKKNKVGFMEYAVNKQILTH